MEARVVAQDVTQVRCPSVVLPIEQCAWCWPHLHPTQPYPAAWSSTICQEHSAWVLAQSAARRAARTRKEVNHVSST